MVFKAQHSENEVMASSPITYWQIDGETMETVTDFYFLISLGGLMLKLQSFSHLM